MKKLFLSCLGLSSLVSLALSACGGPAPTSTVSISPSTLTLNAGSAPQTFTATVTGSSAVHWTLSPASGAGTLSGNSGTSTVYTPPVSVGSPTQATLTAALADGSAIASATITVNTAPAASLELSPASAALNVGQTQAFTVVAKDASGSVVATPALTWTSSDGSVASVNSGTASALASGVSAITAKAGSLTSNAVNLLVRPSSGVLTYSVLSGGTYQVHHARLDGTQDIKVADGWNPHFSPDGKFLAYQRGGTHPSGTGDDLYVFDLGTVSEKKLTSNGDYIVSTNWTPDGQNLIFDVSCSIYRIKRDGTGAAALRNGNCYDDAPAVNPIDGRIAFHNTITGGLWLMNSGGGSAAAIPNTQVGDMASAWSPDGVWISFLRGDKNNTTRGVLYKIHPDGSGLTRLTPMNFDLNSTYAEATSGWTLDSKFIVADIVQAGSASVQLIDAGGSGAMASIPIAAPDKVDFVGNIVSSTP